MWLAAMASVDRLRCISLSGTGWGEGECSLGLDERMGKASCCFCCCCCCCILSMGAEVRLAADVAASLEGELGSGVLDTGSKILCRPRVGHWLPMLASAVPMLLPSVSVDIVGTATATNLTVHQVRQLEPKSVSDLPRSKQHNASPPSGNHPPTCLDRPIQRGLARWRDGWLATPEPTLQASKPRKARHVNVTAQSSAVPPSPSLHTLPSSCPLRRPARERDCVTLLTGSRLPARPAFQPDPSPFLSLHPNWVYRRSTVTATSRSPATPPLRRVVSHNHTVLPTQSSVPAVANTPTANRGKRHCRSGREVNDPPCYLGYPFGT